MTGLLCGIAWGSIAMLALGMVSLGILNITSSDYSSPFILIQPFMGLVMMLTGFFIFIMAIGGYDESLRAAGEHE